MEGIQKRSTSAPRTLDKERERELNTTVYRRSFSDFMREDHRSGFAVHFLILGNDWWTFEEDNGINPLDPDALDEDDRSAAFNSLGKAELVLSVLQDVVETLAQDIAAYKRREIEGRIEELQQLGLTARMPIEHWMIWDASRRCGTSLASVFEYPPTNEGIGRIALKKGNGNAKFGRRACRPSVSSIATSKGNRDDY